MLKRGAFFGLVLLAACGGSSSGNNNPPSVTGTDIAPSVSAPLAMNLQQAAAQANSQTQVAALGATLALQGGTQATPANINTPPPHSAVPTKSSALSTGAANAFAFQLTLLNVPQGANTQVLSGVLVFTDAADAALAAGPSTSSAIPPGVGLILEGGPALWTATSGQVSATVGQQVKSCPNGASLPAYVTGCTLNDFSNAGFAITASTPLSSLATGSKQVSLPTGGLVGAAISVDCSKTTLCGTSSGSVTVTLSPVMPTVQTGGSVQFTATVTGSSDTAVTWTVVPSSGGGTITSTGLYTAPGTAGTYGVVATSVADTSVAQSTTVTVTSGSAVTVSISPSTVTLAASGTQQFTATVGGTSNTQVTWSVEEGTAGGGVSASGLYTAPGAGGAYHVVATSAADMTKYAVATVTVPGAAWAMVAAGTVNSLGVRTDGSLWTWGSNVYGELGIGATGPNQTTPVKIQPAGYVAVSAGAGFDLALTSPSTNGVLYAWGDNSSGQLGLGSTTNVLSPIEVGQGYAQVSGGFLHTVAVRLDGTLWAWGDNDYGELGNGTTTSETSPIQIGTETDWASVSAGYYYTLAIKTDGTLWAWGYAYRGQLGTGASSGNQLIPFQIGTGFAFVAASWYSSYAIKTDGTLWAWGWDFDGGLGDGATTTELAPIPTGTTGFATITGCTQSNTGLGVKTDGTVWAFGNNSSGQFGNGTVTSSGTQEKVNTGYASVKFGSADALGLKPDGSLWAWGDNTYGELGIGSTAVTIVSPVPVP